MKYDKKVSICIMTGFNRVNLNSEKKKNPEIYSLNVTHLFQFSSILFNL